MKKKLTYLLITIPTLIFASPNQKDSVGIEIHQIPLTETSSIIYQFNISELSQIFLFIISIVFLLFILFKFSQEINFITKSFFNQNIFSQLLSSKNSILQNLLQTLNIFGLILIGILLSKHIKIQIIPHLANTILFPAITISFYFIKKIAEKIWTIIFSKKASEIIKLQTKISNLLLSFITIPLLFLATYSPQCSVICLKVSYLTALIIYLLRIKNITINFFKRSFSLFYLILYLCTVEILPALIFIKAYYLNN